MRAARPTWIIAAATFGPYGVDERTYAASLWQTVPDHSVVLIDRNYLQASVLVQLLSVSPLASASGKNR